MSQTPKDALDYLLGFKRLRFGDDAQIGALNLLRCAEELIGMEYECSDCDGTGEVEDDEDDVGHCDVCGHACSHCSGRRRYSSIDACSKCDGEGTVRWKRDEVYHMPEETVFELNTGEVIR